MSGDTQGPPNTTKAMEGGSKLSIFSLSNQIRVGINRLNPDLPGF